VPSDAVLFYLAGGMLIAFGFHIISRQAFPRWMTGIWLWPLIRISAAIVLLSGWASVLGGTAAISYTFARFVPVGAAWLLGFGIACGATSLLLLLYATWLSRRPEPGAQPPRV
jgi:hypothetical protein